MSQTASSPASEIDALEQEQRTDHDRLLWLVEHDASFGTTTNIEYHEATGVTTSRSAQFARVPCRLMYEWHCYHGATWRDALDAAMDAPPCTGSDGYCDNSRSIREPNAEHPLWAERDAMREEILSLRAALQQSRADSERLDWMEQNVVHELHFKPFADGVILKRWHTRYVSSHDADADSVRDAIDVLRAAFPLSPQETE